MAEKEREEKLLDNSVKTKDTATEAVVCILGRDVTKCAHGSSPTTTKFRDSPAVNQLTGHCETTDEQPDVSSPDHDPLALVSANSGVLILPRGPDTNEQNQDVEDHNSHETLGVDGHLPLVRFPAEIKCYCARTGNSWRELGGKKQRTFILSVLIL